MNSLDLETLKAFIAHIDDSVGLLRDIVDDLVDEAETMEPILLGLGLDSAVREELQEILTAIDDLDVAVGTLELQEVLAALDADRADTEPAHDDA